jgi:hypothetical protein
VRENGPRHWAVCAMLDSLHRLTPRYTLDSGKSITRVNKIRTRRVDRASRGVDKCPAPGDRMSAAERRGFALIARHVRTHGAARRQCRPWVRNGFQMGSEWVPNGFVGGRIGEFKRKNGFVWQKRRCSSFVPGGDALCVMPDVSGSWSTLSPSVPLPPSAMKDVAMP